MGISPKDEGNAVWWCSAWLFQMSDFVICASFQSYFIPSALLFGFATYRISLRSVFSTFIFLAIFYRCYCVCASFTFSLFVYTFVFPHFLISFAASASSCLLACLIATGYCLLLITRYAENMQLHAEIYTQHGLPFMHVSHLVFLRVLNSSTIIPGACSVDTSHHCCRRLRYEDRIQRREWNYHHMRLLVTHVPVRQ